jgi:hypothetical protein
MFRASAVTKRISIMTVSTYVELYWLQSAGYLSGDVSNLLFAVSSSCTEYTEIYCDILPKAFLKISGLAR